MTCPDWSTLAAWRQGDGPAPPGWRAALGHLAGCADCRRRAAEVDPTLLLCAAPAPEVGEPEIARVRAMVRALRRSGGLDPGQRPARRAHRALAVAALLAALLAAPIAVDRLGREAPAGPAIGAPGPLVVTPPAGDPPLIEEVLPSRARIYEFGSEDLPVVLIVDETLDL